jgi:hypothetical protein
LLRSARVLVVLVVPWSTTSRFGNSKKCKRAARCIKSSKEKLKISEAS